MKIILNGRLMVAEDAHISPFDRGLNLGDGVFDTMLCREGQSVFSHAHFSRLAAHAAIAGIPLPYGADELMDFAHALLCANDFTSGSFALRTTLTCGMAERGLLPPEQPTPTLIMRASPAPQARPSISAIIAANTRRNEYSPLSRIKSLNYGDNILALREAKIKGADEALMLNTHGNIACTSTGNIFIALGNGRIITPPQKDGVLDGITRRVLLEHPQCVEETVTQEMLADALAVFTCNSLRGIQCVSHLNGHTIRQVPEIQAELSSFLDNQAAR